VGGEGHALTATILVTDVVGSTAVRAALGEEEAERHRRAHDAMLAAAIERHGGEVVKGLGDGALARFAGAADAVAAAVAIQRGAVDLSRRSAGRPMEIRIGISAGDVSVEDGDCFGTPVIEASRLCAAARGGQILAAHLVQLLSRGRGGHAFTAVGELELKGLPEPVPVAEVGWERQPTDVAMPLPDAISGEERFPFAGRRASRAGLDRAWKKAVSGSRRVVLVSGEPGVGKSRLVTEFARQAHRDGAAVVFGGADEDIETSFGPWIQALEHLVANLPDDVLDGHLADWGGTLCRLLPALRLRADVGAVPTGDDERAVLYRAIIDLLTRAAAEAPVLVVLDDLHWADHSTLLFLRHLIRATTDVPLLVVGTYRDTDLNRNHPLAGILADLRRERNVERLALSGLDGSEVRALVGAVAGHELDDELGRLVDRIHDETEGNPFFVGEILTHLVESGAVVRRDGRWLAEEPIDRLSVPEGVREVLGRRLASLDAGAEEALRTAAVVGGEFDATVVAEVAGIEIEALLDVLEVVVARGLVVEVPGAPDRYRFAHSLVRRTIYDELSSGRRTRAHHKVLMALEALRRGSIDELAHHACEAVAVAGASRAVDLAVAAASKAKENAGWEQAVSWYRRALEAHELGDEDEQGRARLHLELGYARQLAEDFTGARSDHAAAASIGRRIGDQDVLIEAAIAYSLFGRWADPFDHVGPALVDEALEIVGDEDSVQRVQLLLAKESWRLNTRDPAERPALTRSALAAARRLGDLQLEVTALCAALGALIGLPHADEHETLSRDLSRALAALDQPSLPEKYTELVERAQATIVRGHLERFERVVVEMAEEGVRRRSPGLQFRARSMDATLALLVGDPQRAQEQIEASAPLVNLTYSSDTVVHHVTKLNHATLTGTPAQLGEVYASVRAQAPYFWNRLPYTTLCAGLSGDIEQAAQLLPDFVDQVLPGLAAYVRASVATLLTPLYDAMSTSVATALRAHVEPFEGTWIAISVEAVAGSADIHLGRLALALGDADQAVERLERAVEEHRRAGEVPLRTWATADLAEALRRRGGAADLDRSHGLASEVVGVADRYPVAGGVARRTLERLG
jgi:class 3 adenylate cyclase/tetratricopeptide (TPR) repeat protein